MVPPPTQERLETEKAENLSRFESEGGPPECVAEQRNDPPDPGLQPSEADQRGRILIVYANRKRSTCAIADALALRLEHHGFAIEIGDPGTGTMPPPQDYDIVVLGVPTTFGRESELIATYIEHNRAGLSDVPSALFLVSTTGALGDGFRRQFLGDVGWQPDLAAAFSPDSEASPPSAMDVGAFADAIAADLANAAVTAERSEPHAADTHSGRT